MVLKNMDVEGKELSERLNYPSEGDLQSAVDFSGRNILKFIVFHTIYMVWE